MERSKKILLFLFTCLLIMSSSALAFEDLSDKDGKREILELQKKGIINGVDAKHFAPNRSLTYLEAAVLLMKAFDLKMIYKQEIQLPKVTDIFPKISGLKNDAWYSEALVIADKYGFKLPNDFTFSKKITREEFAYYLYQIVMKHGPYALIKIWYTYEDMDDVNEAYRGSINDLLIMKIVELDKEGKFRPKDAITRKEAALMVHKALKFIEEQKNVTPPSNEEPVSVQIEKVNEQVKKVTIYWGEMPNPGYKVTIDKIEFLDNEAIIYYTLHRPDPNMFYPQVITEAKASTFIDAKYEVKTKQINDPNQPIGIELPGIPKGKVNK